MQTAQENAKQALLGIDRCREDMAHGYIDDAKIHIAQAQTYALVSQAIALDKIAYSLANMDLNA